MENRFMAHWFKLFGLYTLVLFLLWLSTSSYFYEDGIYVAYSKSFIEDLDFNIINQVELGFARIVSEKFSHPAHHSIFQTPLLILLHGLEELFSIISLIKLENFKLAGIFLSFISITLGFQFTREAGKEFNIDLKISELLIYFFSTAFVYFSFMTLTVIELFMFPLSACTLLGLMRIYNRSNNQLNGFLLGTLCGMLFTSKAFFAPLTLVTFLFVLIDKWKLEKSYIVKFISGALPVLTIAYLKDYASFGGINTISKAMSVMNIFSVRDILFTIWGGLVGPGGIFFVNPAYAAGIVGFSIIILKIFKMDIRSLGLSLGLGLWIIMSSLWAFFLVGPILEDHYPGRITLTALPLLLLGFSFLVSKIKLWSRILMSIFIISFQFWTLSNYMFISSKGHYAYAMKKFATSPWEVLRYMKSIADFNSGIFISHFSYMLLASFVISGFIWWSWRYEAKLKRAIFIYLIFSTSFLGVATILNLIHSQTNGRAYLEEKGILNNITMSNHGLVFSFVYITDALKTQYYNTQDPELRELIVQKHTEYLHSLKPHLLHASPKFLKAIEDENTKFGYYMDRINQAP